MGKLWSAYLRLRNAKQCTLCGCLMDADHEDELCECCLDDLYESDPGEPEDEEESLYPRLMITNEGEKIKELADKRIESLKARKNETPEERSLRLIRENSIYGLYGYERLKSIADLGDEK